MPKPADQLSLANSYRAIALGLQRGALTMLEYPIHNMKARWQASADPNASLFKTGKTIYQRYGLKGYFHGFIPYLATKGIPAQLYRWPLICELPPYLSNIIYEQSLSTASYQCIATVNGLTALTLTTVETIIGAPFENCRLELSVNRQRTSSLRDYFSIFNSLRAQYFGLAPLFAKNYFGWSSFLVVTSGLRAYRERNYSEMAPLPRNILISSAVGFFNATAILPWDVARVEAQKQHRAKHQELGLFKLVEQIVQGRGFGALWRGWTIRFVQMALATLLSLPVMDAYDEQSTLVIGRPGR